MMSYEMHLLIVFAAAAGTLAVVHNRQRLRRCLAKNRVVNKLYAIAYRRRECGC